MKNIKHKYKRKHSFLLFYSLNRKLTYKRAIEISLNKILTNNIPRNIENIY